jgi:RNA polymerase sigma factor (sigma-70 family)
LADFRAGRLFINELMNVTGSQELLAEYVKNGSEGAFRELVTRYLDLVYSTALRCVEGDAHRAQDVAQTVFLDLARLASRLSRDSMLGGWLHRHTCYVASNVMRGERRREARERIAAEMNALEHTKNSGLAQLGPMLDAAINELDDEDRKAILLRFYERLDLRSVGQALGSSENAAQKRVSRALEQLHSILTHHGVMLSLAALTAILTGEAVTAAPAALATSIVSTALAGAATGAGVSVTLLKFSPLAKAKLAFAAAVVAGGVATTLWLQHQSQLKLAEENRVLRQQLTQPAQFTAANEIVSPPLEAARLKPISRRPLPPAQVLSPTAEQPASDPVFPEGGSTVGPAQTAFGTTVYGVDGPVGHRIRFYTKSGSKMRIEGTSNIHNWQVESSLMGGFLEVGPNFPVEPGKPAKPGKMEARAEPFVMVHSLKSVDKDGRPYSDRMDQQMYTCLKSATNPKISFDLAESTLKDVPKSHDRPYVFEAKGELAVAGVTNEITMPVNILPLSDKNLKISGAIKVKMTDFNIDPPKMGPSGEIKIGDEVKLSFDWMLAQRNSTSSETSR